MTNTVKKPSLSAYRHLQYSQPSELICPCSNTKIPYATFTTLSPRVHQICSSVFVSEPWISTMKRFDNLSNLGITSHHFRFLSTLCQFINVTLKDTIYRFSTHAFVTIHVIDEVQFNIQVNSILHQLVQTVIIDFNRFTDAIALFVHVNQPYSLPLNAYDAFILERMGESYPFHITVHNHPNESIHLSMKPFLLFVVADYIKGRIEQ